MTALRLLAALTSVAFTLVGCYRDGAKDTALTERVAKLEARVAEQDKALAQAQAQNSAVELGILAQKLDGLMVQLDRLQALQAQAGAPPTRPKRREPDPALTYSVPLGGSPELGPAKAKVTMVMFFEFACPYCQRAWATIDDLRKKYPKDLRVVYKQFVVHPTTATAAALASCAAERQGKWRQTAELLWTKAFDTRQFDQANIDAIAQEAGLDTKQYQADIAGACVQELADDKALAGKLAVSATPSFFINGRFLSGAQPIDKFSALIDEELAKATAAVKRGVKADKLYDQEIVGKGVTEVPTP